jgi:hypothetical protein
MNITIVSVTNHDAQLVESDADSEQRLAQKLALREVLQARFIQNNILAVFEESKQGQESIASQLAGLSVPPILWRNISMTDDERSAAGILNAHRPSRVDWNWDDMPPKLIEDRIPADTIREDFFVSQILQAKDSEGGVLVLLGNEHVVPVAGLLRAKGHAVNIQES